MYEQARSKGHVRVITNDFARSPTSTRAQVNTPQSRSDSNRSNPQPSRYTPASRIAGSHSEGHAWNNPSHFVPARASPGQMNTNENPSGRPGSNGSNATKPLSRAHSEPKQYTHSPNSGYGRSSFRASTPLYMTKTPPQVKINNTGVRARVESPSWLASYPDEDADVFITPPLSPITSPKISSGLLGSSRSEPALTLSTNSDSPIATGGKPASEDGNRAFRSPKPVQKSSSSRFITPNHLSPNEIIDMLTKDLGIIRVISPSTSTTDDLSYASKTPGHPRDSNQRSTATSPVSEEQESLNPITPYSNSARYKLLPKTRVTTPSRTKDSGNGNLPSRSVLFSQSRMSCIIPIYESKYHQVHPLQLLHPP